jgi:tight adherence protein B
LTELLRIGGLLGFGVAVFVISYHYNTRMLEWLRFQSLGTRDYIVDRLATMFVQLDPQTVLLALFGCSFGLGLTVLLAFGSSGLWVPGILFGCAMTVVGWKAPKPAVDWLYRRRVSKLVLQMVDGLNLMSNGLKSGLSVVQSLDLVVREMPNPIQQEFNLILSENRLGVALEEAFNNFARRVRNDDVEMFVTAINILKETGGNLAETFDTIVTTIRERIKVEKKIAAMTAQGFYQGMFVMAVPPILAAVFYQSDPEFMAPLFTTALGWVIIMVIIALEVVGFFVIMRIIRIDV